MRRTPTLILRLLRRIGLPPRVALLGLSDFTALTGTALLILLARAAFGGVDTDLYRWVFPLLLFSPLLAASLGLYNSVSLPPHRMLKTMFQFVSLVYGIILMVLFLSKEGDLYSRLVIVGGWGVTLFTLPLLRQLCIRLFSHREWWGRPLLIFEQGEMGKRLWHYLRRHPDRGLRPVEMVALPPTLEQTRLVLAGVARRWPDAAALLLPVAGGPQAVDYVAEVSRHFAKIILIPDFEDGFRRYWLTPCELAGVTGLLLSQNLHDRRRLAVKRVIDLLFCLLLLPLLVPLGLLLGLLIRLDSPGPVLYRQKRVGAGGRLLQVYKFRTMCADADARLKEWLARDPALRAEWERDQKLRHDPRITRMGRFLRKTSLDELPQLINVARGDMSLVGPRPIVSGEAKKYGQVFDEYCRVRPGITGLWQISGRNNTTYAERVALDHYYINNWSVWMDIWILARTVPVVLTGYGAY